MTEKRYYVNSACYLCDTDLSNTLSIFECADLLNKLVEENRQLIDEAEEYRKLSIQFDNRNKDLTAENALLEKENQELKQQLTSILKLTKKIEDYTHDIKIIGDME